LYNYSFACKKATIPYSNTVARIKLCFVIFNYL
jgi:hypothetical protein